MPEIPDVAPGETIQVSWGNPIRSRTVLRYASAAARDASVPVPVSGDVAWLQDVNEVTVYNGATWDSLFTSTQGGPITAPISATSVRVPEAPFPIAAIMNEDGSVVAVSFDASSVIGVSPDGSGNIVSEDSGGTPGDGGFIGVKAAQGSLAFQGIKGGLVDGANQSTGSLSFFYRLNATDTALTRSAIIGAEGSWTFDKTISTEMTGPAATEYGSPADITAIINNLLTRIQVLELA